MLAQFNRHKHRARQSTVKTVLIRSARRIAVGLVLVAAVAALIIVLAVSVSAVPRPSHRFLGNVTVNGSPSPEGITVSARIDEVKYESGVVDSQGRYGYDIEDLFYVPADYRETRETEGGVNGENIEFYVSGVLGGNALFATGGLTELDLAVEFPGTCGDVNNDGEVNMADVMILWYDVADYPYPGAWSISNEWAADVNCDGNINMADVMRLWYDIADYPSPGAWEVSCCPIVRISLRSEPHCRSPFGTILVRCCQVYVYNEGGAGDVFISACYGPCSIPDYFVYRYAAATFYMESNQIRTATVCCCLPGDFTNWTWTYRPAMPSDTSTGHMLIEDIYYNVDPCSWSWTLCETSPPCP